MPIVLSRSFKAVGPDTAQMPVTIHDRSSSQIAQQLQSFVASRIAPDLIQHNGHGASN
jgi:hypothetical protein